MRKMRKTEIGQSLIEITFFLVLLLILIAGVVELGAVMNVKLTVVNSAREGARFGTVGATDVDITLVTQEAASSMLMYREENSEVYVIHAKTSEDGSIANVCPQDRLSADSYWCVDHTLGDGAAMPDFVVREQVQEELGSIPDTEAVGVAVEYDHQSLIGLPFIDYLVGTIPINSYTVMRVDTTGEGSVGCPVWPIGVSQGLVDTLSPGDLVKDSIEGGDQGNFGWLSWNGDTNAETIEDSLKNPLSGECVPGQHGDICYTNAANDEDHTLSIDDWTTNATGWVQSAVDEIEALDGRFVRIVIWDKVQNSPTDGTKCTGNACVYHVAGYAIVQIMDIDGDGSILNASTKSLEAKFIRVDTSCN